MFVAQTKCRAYQKALALAMQNLQADLPPREKRRPSLIRNCLTELSKFAIVASDQQYVLQLVDAAMAQVSPPEGLKVLLTLSRMGQKSTAPLVLTDVVHPSVHRQIDLSVHLAVAVRDREESVDLPWSRHGVSEMLEEGCRGRVFTAFSLHEAANFQSSCDRNPLHVKAPLAEVLTADGAGVRLNFIQLYCDGPHQHQTPFFKHPVSRVICCGAVVDGMTLRYVVCKYG